MAANYEALELWMEIKTQWRTGPAGIIGLDYPALYLEAERLEIELSPRTMGKIKALERATLEKAHAGSKSQKSEPAGKEPG